MSETSNPQGTDFHNVASAASALEALMPDEGEQEGEAQTDDSPKGEESESEEIEASQDDEVTDDNPDEQDEQDEASQKPQTVKVKVDGEEMEVTLDELKSGYSRTKDYTKKTQEIAQIRKQAESEIQAVIQERQQYQQLLGQLAQQVAAEGQAEPDWEFLAQNDPIEYSRQWTDWQRKQQKAQVIQAEQRRVAALNQQAMMQQMQQTLEANKGKLLEAIPEWKDPAKAKAEKSMIREQGKKLGFTDQELEQAYDHRAILALRKAALYDQMMSKRQEIKPVKSTQSVAPGSRNVAGTTDAKRAQQQLRQTGKVTDAAKALQFLLS